MNTYIMKSHDLYKIGKAKNVIERLKTFKIGNPYIDLVNEFKGDYERYLHGVFKDKRQVGEWFRLSEEDINNIEKIISEKPKIERQLIKIPEFIKSPLRNHKPKFRLSFSKEHDCWVTEQIIY